MNKIKNFFAITFIIFLSTFFFSCVNIVFVESGNKDEEKTEVLEPEDENPGEIEEPQNQIEYEDNHELLLGNPSGAVNSIDEAENYLLSKSSYSVSYNNSIHSPNWVAWHLSASDLGSSGRSDTFKPDSELPESWYQVKHADYTNSGFDRGHLCPSADRTSSSEANEETFFMTNIIPQSPNNN